MSKYLYVIIPIVLMAAFLGIYIHETKVMEVESIRLAAEAKAKAEADAKHMQELREKSALEAKLAAEKRKAEQDKKDADKEAAYQQGLQKLRTETAGYVAEQDKFKAQIADLQKQVSAIRTDKENLSRQSIDMNQSIVAALIERQNAEMEVQRYAAMVARRATDSPLTRPLVTPTPPAPAQ